MDRNHALILSLLIVLTGSATPSASCQTTWHVLGNGTWSGSGTQAAPFGSIQQALYYSTSGDSILVQPGLYQESLDFLGKNVFVRATGGPGVTTIDAMGLGTVVRFIAGEGPMAVLEGFTITGGHGTGTVGAGGIFMHTGTSPTVRGCTITGNTTPLYGGGVLGHLGSSGIIEGCTITGNTAGYGGGVYIRGMSQVRGCQISGNTATTIGGGGVMLNESASIIDSVVTANTSQSRGGGIRAVNPGPGFMIARCTVSNNTGYQGGGIYLDSSDFLLEDCVVSDNTATTEGGGVYGAARLTLEHCAITGNVSGSFGGGVLTSELNMFDCLVAHNTSFSLGGGVRAGGTTLIQSCTVTQNAATIAGGGLYVRDPVITGCIIWGNAGGQLDTLPGAAPVVSDSYVEGGYPGSGNIGAGLDPVFIDPMNGDFHLAPGSPCIDAVTHVMLGNRSRDLDGHARHMGAYSDMGAYEWGTAPWLVVEQPQGPGSAAVEIQGAPAGLGYFTAVTLDPQNAGGGLGSGPWVGLYIQNMELLQWAGAGVPPFVGFVDGSGFARWETATGLPPSATTVTVYAVCRTWDPTSLVWGPSSAPIALTIP